MARDPDDAEERSRATKDERESAVEDVLGAVREDLGTQSYPTTSEDLAATYADGPIDLPNETESLESAFDRIDDQFADADEAYEALLTEFEGGTYRDRRADAADGQATWSEERVDDHQPPADDDAVGGPEASRERASRTQAADAESDGDE